MSDYEPAYPGIEGWLDYDIEQWNTLWTPTTPKVATGFRASGLGWCDRVQLLKRAGVPETKTRDTKSRRTLEWGNDIHHFVRRRFERLGILVAEEVKLESEALQLTGHLDAMVGGVVQPYKPKRLSLLRTPGQRRYDEVVHQMRRGFIQRFGEVLPPTVVEIKSTHSYGMKRAHKEGQVSRHHQLQLAGYHLLIKNNPGVLPSPQAYNVLMVGKDSVGFLTFALKQWAIDEALDTLEALRDLWASGKWPDCTCGSIAGMEWEKKYCSYTDGDGGCCSDSLEGVYLEARGENDG